MSEFVETIDKLVGSVDSIQTTNNTQTTIDTYALSNNATTVIDVVVVAKQTAGTSSPDGAMYKISAAYYRDSNGAPVQIKAPVIESNNNATGTHWSVALTISGNNALIQVTGDTAKTITWKCVRQGFTSN